MSSESVAELILRADYLIAEGQTDQTRSDTYRRIFIISGNDVHSVTLEDMGSMHGELNVQLIVDHCFPAEVCQGNIIQGPFGLVECTEVHFVDDIMSVMTRRFEKFILISQIGRTLIKVDLDTVGAFIVRHSGPEEEVV